MSILDNVLGGKREEEPPPPPRHRAEALERKGLFEQAGEAYLEADEPLNAGHCFRKAKVWDRATEAYRQANDWMAAAECEKRAAAERKESERRDMESYWRESALQNEEAGRWDLAAEAFEKVHSWERAAECYEKAENWPPAAQCYLKAGRLEPAARSFRRAGQREKAAELFEEAGAWAEAGEAYEWLEEWTRAGDCFVKANEFESARRTYAKGERWDRLASVAFKEGDFDEGIEFLIKAKRNDVAARRLLRRAVERLNEPKAALKDMKQAHSCYNIVGLRGAIQLLEGVIEKDAARVHEGAAILESGKEFEPKAARELLAFAKKTVATLKGTRDGPKKEPTGDGKRHKRRLELIEELVRKGTISRVEYERLKKKHLTDLLDE